MRRWIKESPWLAPVIVGVMLLVTPELRAAPVVTGNYEMDTLDEGDGWRIARFDSLVRSQPPTELYIVAGVSGIQNSPLPRGEKKKLIELARSVGNTALDQSDIADRLFIVHKDIVDTYWNQGYVPSKYRAETKRGCEDYRDHVAESFSPSFPISHTMPIDHGSASGEVDLAVTINPDLDLAFQYHVSHTSCVPSSVMFESFDIDAAISLIDGNVGVTLQSEFKWSKTFQHTVASPTIWRLSFAIGVIPVVINFKLPMNVGAVVSTGAVGSTSASVDWSGSFGLDYRCQLGDCSGTSSRAFEFSNPLTTATASLQADLKAKPFLDARVRANLYTDSLLFAEVGLRAGVQNRLWGYVGNECGDGDGDGVNELVRGAVFDSYFDLQLPYAWGGLFGSGEKFEDLYRKSIDFKDLLNPIENNAIAPTLRGPGTAAKNVPTVFQVEMRPCYPLAANPILGLATESSSGDQETKEYDLKNGGQEDLLFTFESAGDQILRGVNVKDKIGRTIDSYSTLPVAVPSDICDPSCPPTIVHRAWWDHHNNHPRDFRLADYQFDYSLGWDIDTAQYPSDAELHASGLLEYYDRHGEKRDELTTSFSFAGEPIADFDDMNIWEVSGDAPAYYAPLMKICLTLNPDVNHVLTDGDLSFNHCIEVEDYFPIIVLAEVVEDTQDIQVSWRDDNLDLEDNDFTLLRRDSGSMVYDPLAAGLETFEFLDQGLSAGEYIYAIESHGIRYESDPVTVSEGGNIRLPIFFFNASLDYSDGPRMGVEITDDSPQSVDLHQHQISIDGGPWLDSGLDSELSIESGDHLFGLTGTYTVQFRTAWWDGVVIEPWYESDVYDVLIRDWGLDASHGTPSATGVPAGMIRLDWNVQDGVDTYLVEKKLASTGGISTLSIDQSPPFFDGDVVIGEAYSYRISAVDEPWSVAVEGLALVEATLPETSSYIAASDDVLDHVLVHWEELGNTTGYELFRRDSYLPEPEPEDLIAVIPGANSLQYVDNAAPVDTVLYYWIRGVNGEGHGAFGAHATGFRPTVSQHGLDLSVHSFSGANWVQVGPFGILEFGFIATGAVQNSGVGPIPGFTYRIWISEDQTIDPLHDHLVEDTLHHLPATVPTGGFVVLPHHSNPRPPGVSGSRWLILELDPEDFIPEVDEENNTAVWGLTF